MSDISNKDSRANFDVIAFAKSILYEVDAVRAFSKTSDDKTEGQVQTYIESRVNAFFRLIGLPMFVEVKPKNERNAKVKAEGFSGEQILTPGFSRTVSPTLDSVYNIVNSTKVEISKEAQSRESYLLKIENNIGTQKMNDDMLEALKTPIPLQANVVGMVGESGRIVQKKLKPLMTVRLADGVLPRRNELARPFLSEKDDDKIDSDTILPKPFIETVIRIRLVEAGGGGDAANREKVSDFQNSIKAALGRDKDGDDIFDQVFSNYKKAFSETDVREDFILSKLLGALQLLANKWVNIKRKQTRLASEIESNILIKTSSAKSSPFARRASISTTLSNDSTLSKKIRHESEKIAVEESYLSLLTSDDVARSSAITPKVAATKNTATSALNRPFTEIMNNDLTQFKKNLSNLNRTKKKKAAELDKLRIELEMMTGEFTGLSIPDVIITMTALFLITDKDLLGLLDSKTLKEMENDDILKRALESVGSPTDTITAVANLGLVVDDLYTLLKTNIAIVVDRKTKTSVTSRANRRKAKSTKRSVNYSE